MELANSDKYLVVGLFGTDHLLLTLTVIAAFSSETR